jgi:septal ring factor EnvC (AmiA/AmiB activator)
MLAGLLLLAVCSPVLADGEVDAEQLKRMYDGAVAQLRTAQDRRNELARENDKLAAQIRDLQKQLSDARAETQTITDRTFKMRAQYAAFSDFVKRYPAIDARWRLFMRSDVLGGTDRILEQLNSDWPLPDL